LAQVKREEYYRHDYVTKTKLVAAVDNWVLFYKAVRQHSTIEMLSPNSYETPSGCLNPRKPLAYYSGYLTSV
jgi:integrase-like protein